MKIDIRHADQRHIADCINILQNSEIGTIYFANYEKAFDLLSTALMQQKLFVALSPDDACLGFMYYMSNGVFGSYPYLHLLAVKKEYRGLGIGKQLIAYFEKNSSHYPSTKCFLTVDDFNVRAKKLYEDLGYQCVGTLPDFYKAGITSYIMMKATNR